MKVKPEHYKVILEKTQAAILLYPNALAEYKVAGLSATRYRWDIARAAGLIPYFCGVLYQYCDDTHIDTALNHAIPF